MQNIRNHLCHFDKPWKEVLSSYWLHDWFCLIYQIMIIITMIKLKTSTEITFKPLTVSHHRYGRNFPRAVYHLQSQYLWKRKCQHDFILIYCKNNGSLRVCWSPVVCNLHPCYVKLRNKGCSRRDPFPVLLTKAWSNWMFSYYSRKNTE